MYGAVVGDAPEESRLLSDFGGVGKPGFLHQMENRVVKAGFLMGRGGGEAMTTPAMVSFTKVDELQGPTGFENTVNLAEGSEFCSGLDVVKHERGQHLVERGVGEGELL